MEIIGAGVDHHSSPYDIPHTETVCPHSQMRIAMARQQRRQVSGMLRMAFPCRIIVAARLRKTLSGAGSSLVDMHGEKTGLVILREAAEIGHDQNSPALLIKPDLSG